MEAKMFTTFITLTKINGDKTSAVSEHITFAEAVGKNTAQPFTFLFVKGANKPVAVLETPAEIEAARNKAAMSI